MEKQRQEESERRSQEVRRAEKRKSEKKEDAGARKGRKVAIHSVFPMICGSGGSTSRLAKAAGPEPAGQMRDEKLHTVVARSTFPSQNVRNTPRSDRSWDVEKVHAIVARSTFPSQIVQSTPFSDHFWKLRCRKSACRCGAKHISKSNVQSTPFSDHFWKLRCRKSSCRCGAKHISKSKCTKHSSFGPLLEVEMSEKCTPLWREAHFQVNWRVRTTFWRSDVARSTFGSQKCQKLGVLSLFWRSDVKKVHTD